MLFQHSLSKRLLAGTAILGLLGWGCVWLMVNFYLQNQMEQEIIKRANTTLHSVQIAIQTYEGNANVVRLVNALAAAEGIEEIIVVKPVNNIPTIIAANENSWINTNAAKKLPPAQWQRINSALRSSQPSTYHNGKLSFESILPTDMRSADLRSIVSGAVSITLNSALIEQQTRRSVLLVSALLFMIIGLILCLFYAFLQYSVLGPVESLRQAMLHHADQGLIMYAPVARGDEIGQLSQTYNTLLDTIRSYETRLSVITDTVVDGLITVNSEEQIISVNRAAERIFGYPARAMLMQPFTRLMADGFEPKQDGCHAIYQQTNHEKEMSASRELLAHRSNGECFPIELAVGRAVADNQIIYVSIVRDITERKKNERIKSEFISTINHELRTPLTSILGSLGLLQSNLFGELPPKVKQLLSMAHKNCGRLAHLINDILDIEKIEAGRLSLKITELDVMPFLQNVLELNQGYAESYSVQFAVSHASPGLKILADQDRLNQVMANLLSNAAKFSPTGAEVQIHAQQIGAMLQIAVHNSGEGIAEEFQSRIFERFSQADSTTTRKHEGSGLGLNITKKLVEAMHGQIRFQSTVGQGTSFFISLPLAPGQILDGQAETNLL